MSDADFAALDKAFETVDGVVQKIHADKRAQEASQAVEDCRFRAVGERSAARAFFTSLALALEPCVDSSGEIETAATDGKRLPFSPEWILGLSPEERYGVMIGHEPMHCAMEHFARMRGMDDGRAAQIAADLEINPICRDAGFTLPDAAIFPGVGEYAHCPPGKTMEEYYVLVKEEREEGDQGDQGNDGGDGEGNDPGGCGGVQPAPDQAAAEHSANTWKGRVAAAAQNAGKRGNLPGSLERWIERILKPRVDPWEILREYMTRAVKTEQNWSRLNRRALARGLYLPSRHANELGDVVLLVDTSGSIRQEQIDLIAGFLEGVLSANPGKLTVIYHDHTVQGVQEWVPEDGPLELHPVGGGGTSHVPAFREIENRGMEPSVILAATDLETLFPKDPGIPTIWIDVEGGHTPPFGQYVCIV